MDSRTQLLLLSHEQFEICFQILKMCYPNYSIFLSCVYPSNCNYFPCLLPGVTYSDCDLCFIYNEPKLYCGCWGLLHHMSKLQQQLFSRTHKIICPNGFCVWLAEEIINKNEKLKFQVAIPWKRLFLRLSLKNHTHIAIIYKYMQYM